MTARPSVVLFDVNETLSDLSPLRDRFAQAGAPPHLAGTWFASVLRDGFALAAAGASRPFAEVAEGVARTVLAEAGVADLDAGVEQVMAGLQELDVHPDVPAGVRALRAAGLRLASLTNGSVATSRALFARAGVDADVEQVLSVEDAGLWKPARRAYDHAVAACGVPAAEVLLVAVHPWDVDGASRAGLQTAWLDRSGTPYPGHLRPPDRAARDLVALAAALAREGSGSGA